MRIFRVLSNWTALGLLRIGDRRRSFAADVARERNAKARNAHYKPASPPLQTLNETALVPFHKDMSRLSCRHSLLRGERAQGRILHLQVIRVAKRN